MNIKKQTKRFKLLATPTLFFLLLLPLMSFGQTTEVIAINNQKFTKVTEVSQLYLLDRSGTKYPLATTLETLTDATLALDLSDKHLKEFPAKILQYPQLQILLLNDNQLRVLPIKIGQLSDLRVLNLESNLLRKLPNTFGQLQQLQHLSLEENVLSELSNEVEQLAKLESLNLKKNFLPILPPSIGQLNSLMSFDVSDNHLSTLPKEIGQLKELRCLTLNNNKIEKLPKEFWQLSNLNVLEFSENEVSSLPKEIGQLKKIVSLKLSSNPITVIPNEIKQLKEIQLLKIPALPKNREEEIKKWFPEAYISSDYEEMPMFVSQEINTRFRNDASKQFQKENYRKAFYEQQKAVRENGGYNEWHNLSFYALFVYQPKVAIEAALKAKERNTEAVTVETNLALGYVLNDEWDKAEAIYLKWKGQAFPNSNQTWEEVFIQDITDLEASGVRHSDFDKIKKMFLTKTATDELENTNSGTFKDKRDGQTYKWVRLKDGKKWMAQNLNFEMAGSRCYDNAAGNCAKYGRLYNWVVALEACPEGWRLPSDDEWWEMTSYYGKAYSTLKNNTEGDAGQAVYKALMEDESSGFSARLGGFRDDNGYFNYLGHNGSYWSSTEKSSSIAWYYNFSSNFKALNRVIFPKNWGFSCRCIQDE